MIILLIIINVLCVVLYTINAINSTTKEEQRMNGITALIWLVVLILNIISYCR